jgi:hypothetical protein
VSGPVARLGAIPGTKELVGMGSFFFFFLSCVSLSTGLAFLQRHSKTKRTNWWFLFINILDANCQIQYVIEIISNPRSTAIFYLSCCQHHIVSLLLCTFFGNKKGGVKHCMRDKGGTPNRHKDERH